MTMDSSRVNHGVFVRNIVTKNIVNIQKHVLIYDKYKLILNQAYEKKIEEFISKPKTLTEYEDEILKLKNIIDDIDTVSNKVWLPMLFVDCEELNNGLKDRARGLIQRILDVVSEDNRKVNYKISERYESISANAMKVPNETKELVELTKYLEAVRQNELVKLQQELSESKKRMEFLIDYSILSDEDIKLNANTFTWVSRIIPVLELSKKRIMQKKVKAQEDLKSKIENASKTVDTLFEQVTKLKVFSLI
jgi:dynein heavy chain